MAAQARKKTKNKPINTSLININTAPAKQIWKKHKGAIIGITILVLAVGWYFSDLWPWPSKERVQKRMDYILETCINNENSSSCKNLLQRYNLTFKYCHYLPDSILLEQKYPDITERFKHYSELSYYGVVWEGKSENPPDRTYSINGHTTESPTLYYSCTDHIK